MAWPKGKSRAAANLKRAAEKLGSGGVADIGANDELAGKSALHIDPKALNGGGGSVKGGGSGEEKRDPPAKERKSAKADLKPPADLDISGWDELFVGIHQSLALWTKTPELEIEPSEAQLLANAAGKVARWYKLPGVAQKTIDWANLAMALNVVYGPRVVVMRARKAQEAQEARTRRPTVVPFPNARSNAPPAPDTPAQATDAKTDERARMMDLARFVPTGEPQ